MIFTFIAQPGEPLASAGIATEDRELVLDEPPAAAGQTCPLLLAGASREPSDAAVVSGPTAADCWAASASDVGQTLAAAKSIQSHQARGSG